jgi:hypothetical protein
MREPTSEPRRRHGEGRPQETEVPDARLAAVPFDLVAVDAQHIAEVQEDGRHGLFREAVE